MELFHFVLTPCRFSTPIWPLATLTTQENPLTKPLTSKEIQEETNWISSLFFFYYHHVS